MKIESMPNTAIGYTYCVHSTKLGRAKVIANKTKIIYGYCLKNNISLIAMCFDSSDSKYNLEADSLDNLVYLIKKNRAHEVICVNYEDLNFGTIDDFMFKKFFDRNGVKLTAINKLSLKNQEYIRFVNEEEKIFKESQLKTQKAQGKVVNH